MGKKKRKKMWWNKNYKKKKKKRDWRKYKKDEATYNLIQENEIFIFLKFLPLAALFVCKNKSLWEGIGRPHIISMTYSSAYQSSNILVNR